MCAIGDVLFLPWTIYPITNDVYLLYLIICGPGRRSRYSDSLWDGRSGDRVPVRAKFPAPVQTVPGANLPSHYMGIGSFPGVRRTRLGVDHPPHLAPRLKKEYSYTSILSLGFCGLF